MSINVNDNDIVSMSITEGCNAGGRIVDGGPGEAVRTWDWVK